MLEATPGISLTSLLGSIFVHHMRGTVDGSEIRRSPVDMVVYPMCIPGGAGFLPSTSSLLERLRDHIMDI